MNLSVIIPAYNEEHNIEKCLEDLRQELHKQDIPYEIIVVNDNSRDRTEELVRGLMQFDSNIRIVNRTLPGGFGRAVRSGLEVVKGDVVVIYMADLSDHPADVVAYYRKIGEGFDCVFGSRFMKGSQVVNYPIAKLIVNRIVNNCIKWIFWSKFNDFTNAFKGYRREVILDCGPYRASHFNITIEMSLSALIRRYSIAQIPIHWEGRTWGSSNLNMAQMGRRYLSTLLMLFFQRILIQDDLIAERLSKSVGYHKQISDLELRLEELERKVDEIQALNRETSSV